MHLDSKQQQAPKYLNSEQDISKLGEGEWF